MLKIVNIVLTIVVIVGLLIILGFNKHFLGKGNEESMINPTVSNELQKQGVIIIPFGDPNFENELASYLKGRQEVVKPFLDALKPFTAFVRNNSNKRIVGLSLVWEVTKADGTIRTFPKTELSPNLLLGFTSPNSIMQGSLIPSNSSRFFALGSGVQSLLRNENYALLGNYPSQLTPKNIQAQTNRIPELIDERRRMANQAVKISVRIDGVMFDDGIFYGPDHNRLFATMKASVQAHKDFLQRVRNEVNTGKNQREIFSWMESLATKRPPLPKVSSRLMSEAEKYDYVYKNNLYNLSQEALRKRQKLSDNQIIQKLASKQTNNAVLLRKEAL